MLTHALIHAEFICVEHAINNCIMQLACDSFSKDCRRGHVDAGGSSPGRLPNLSILIRCADVSSALPPPTTNYAVLNSLIR
jgi:hypothetical protein